jgi:D-alanyl-lipoteichoic acid acyltransferase DltB (MBOAT superfamily)
MGFNLMKNFDKPYQSKSISEFWRRWHISLSTWFKDYLYIPLGGNRVPVMRLYLNLFVVFIVSGLWHGANWTYIIWGALHGFYLVFALISLNFRNKINNFLHIDKIPFLSILMTFLLVSFAWIFFRANNVHSAFYIAKSIFTGLPDLFQKLFKHESVIENLGLDFGGIILSFMLILFLELVHYLQRRGYSLMKIHEQPIYFRWAIYIALVYAIIFLGVFDDRQFIYFQF